MTSYNQTEGENIESDALIYVTSNGIYRALEVNKQLIKLVELRQSKDSDIFILNFELDVPSKPKYKIKGKESIAVVVSSDDSIPKVYALRNDFPL
ncbi:MAG: hypothetical protein JKX82_00260, partial [Oleispira sp.]|nr:hypothetical protein [Oleispira sp.]